MGTGEYIVLGYWIITSLMLTYWLYKNPSKAVVVDDDEYVTLMDVLVYFSIGIFFGWFAVPTYILSTTKIKKR
jgi:hypothetical protein